MWLCTSRLVFVRRGIAYQQSMSCYEAVVPVEPKGTIEEILVGPAHENDGTLNLFGALATSMATTGYETIKEFQKAELVIAPSIKTEGKTYQAAQRVGMGH